MKRVHVLTFHRALNYGAILQCYSLYKTISQICECDVIDYRACCIENRYKVFVPGKSLKGIVKALLSADFTVTARKYVGHEDDTGYHHYAVDTAKNYEMEEI